MERFSLTIVRKAGLISTETFGESLSLEVFPAFG